MPTARYFRVVQAETYGYRNDLQLQELRFYNLGSFVDGSATITSSATPTAGALANLKDTNTGTSCTLAGADVATPGFDLAWDLGSALAVDEISIVGSAQASWLHRFTLQSSSDAVTWTNVLTGYRTKWEGAAQTHLITLANTDPNWESVTLYLSGNGTNNSVDIQDSSLYRHTVTWNGDTKISTAQSVYGGSSIYMDGTVDDLVLTHPTAFAFGTGDFTIQFWVRIGSLAHELTLVEMRPVAQNGPYIGALSVSTAGAIAYGSDSQVRATSGNGIMVTNTWQHVELSRSGTTGRIFVDGVQVASGTDSVDYASTRFCFGSNVFTGALNYVGYLDQLSIVKGVALHTAGFTPPAVFLVEDYTPLRAVQTPSAEKVDGDVVGDTTMNTQVLAPVRNDVEDGGAGQIVGTVKEKAIPDNTPLHRRVRLHRDADGRMVRETWSDATTGAYSFTEINPNAKYHAVSFDYEHLYRAVIADNLTPEVA